MIILKKGNVERAAADPAAAARLRQDGYEELVVLDPGELQAEGTEIINEPAVTEEVPAGEPEEPESDLAGMSVMELRREASKRGIKGASAFTKAELLELLQS